MTNRGNLFKKIEIWKFKVIIHSIFLEIYWVINEFGEFDIEIPDVITIVIKIELCRDSEVSWNQN